MRYDHAFGCVSGEPPSGLSTPVARAAHSGSARWRDRATPAKYRLSLPQLGSRLFLTDGGIETTLIYSEGFELPCFAAFDLLGSEAGLDGLRVYYRRYAELARRAGVGLMLEAPTWRANRDWADRLGYDGDELADVNRRAIALMSEIRGRFETEDAPMVISGCIGPRGDGYDPGRRMTPASAQIYHGEQIATFATTAADMVTALTITNVEEAIGIVRAATAWRLPVALSFTVETDGRLPTGQSLAAAIEEVDRETGSAAAYFMLNCAHPDHFAHLLESGEAWTGRLRGIRANASKRSHAELDRATTLDDGDPVELGRCYRRLRERHPKLTVLGGCCGTDHRHVQQICLSCLAA